MRLLKTDTIELHEYFERSIPPYAILSHRWEDGEVTLQKLQNGDGEQMPGYEKIVNCCRQAAKDGWQYVWIDTCCIDKTSSAELSEAINSMYRWYQNSQVCYAYLSDVPSATVEHSRIGSAFRGSEWFTRGWTLQELLAPASVEFYDQYWVEIGTKSSLCNLIQEITKIRALDFTADACVAEKMSWAAMRETTRVEDQAYCLMGLFDIHMPLLYGEGEKAFLRLQQEIWSATNDDSVFAWNMTDDLSSPEEMPLFARMPAWFEDSGVVRRSGLMWGDFNEANLLEVMNVTTRGVDLDFRKTGGEFPLVSVYTIPGSPLSASFLIPLRCAPRTRRRTGCTTEFFGVFLSQRADSTWYRSAQLGIVDIEEIQGAPSPNFIQVYIPDLLQDTSLRDLDRAKIPGVFINVASLRGTGLHVNELVWESVPGSIGIQDSKGTDPEGVFLRTPAYHLPGTLFSLTAAVEISEPSTNFVLLYEYAHGKLDGHESTSTRELISLYVIRRPIGEPLNYLVKRRLQEQIQIWSRDKSDRVSWDKSDRISWPISNGMSISAAVKKGIDFGHPIYIVNITVDEAGELPWPVPFNIHYRSAVYERGKAANFF